jgi:hypothetical protein
LEWIFCGYNEIQNPRKRYALIDYKKLTELLFLFPGSSPGQAKLIALHSGLPLPLVALACGSPYASLQPFRPFLTETPLPSANTFVNVLKTLTLTGFTYRGLSPHKFTPMPGVHHRVQPTRYTRGRLRRSASKKKRGIKNVEEA